MTALVPLPGGLLRLAAARGATVPDGGDAAARQIRDAVAETVLPETLSVGNDAGRRLALDISGQRLKRIRHHGPGWPALDAIANVPLDAEEEGHVTGAGVALLSLLSTGDDDDDCDPVRPKITIRTGDAPPAAAVAKAPGLSLDDLGEALGLATPEPAPNAPPQDLIEGLLAELSDRVEGWVYAADGAVTADGDAETVARLEPIVDGTDSLGSALAGPFPGAAPAAPLVMVLDDARPGAPAIVAARVAGTALALGVAAAEADAVAGLLGDELLAIS